MAVWIQRHRKGQGSVAEVLEACGARDVLRPGDRVLVKPNLVGWDAQQDLPFPPFGVLTTSTVLEGLIAYLRDAGIDRITVGDGSVQNAHVRSGTAEIFERLGYARWRQRYGVRLADLNEGPFTPVDLDEGFSLEVAEEALSSDRLISVPVLKTHGQTVVSLGIKNLKGLLRQRSKMACHRPLPGLARAIALLGRRVPPHLTVIDGLYAMERGPLHFGTPHRFDLVIAGKDPLDTDRVGAAVLGYGLREVPHLAELARLTGRDPDGAEPDARGVPLEEVRRRLRWDWPYSEDGRLPASFLTQGLTAVQVPKYDETLCTGCSFLYSPLLVVALSARDAEGLPACEVLTGKGMRSSGDVDKTFLVGRCIIRENRDNPAIRERIEVKGCPPSLEEVSDALREHGIPVHPDAYARFRRHLMDRYLRRPDTYRLEDYYMDHGSP